MKKISRGISICNGRNTIKGICPKKGFIAGLIMQINPFFADQRFFGVYQDTKIFLSVCNTVKKIGPLRNPSKKVR